MKFESSEHEQSTSSDVNSDASVAQRKLIYSLKDSNWGPNEGSIQHHLKIIASADDLEIFEPSNNVTNEFYKCLSKLLTSVDSRSCLAWSVIEVIQIAVSSSASAVYAITEVHNFIPALCNLMQGSLTVEKKVRLLRILKDLTYGIKIYRQEAYLPPLLRNLCDWSLNEDSTAILVSHALRVLVNLLHGNEIVLHTFMRYLDPKQLCRKLLKVKCIEAYQLLILLNDVPHEKPNSDLHRFVEILFPTLIQNCSENNIAVMQHSVHFFSHIVENNYLRLGLNSYTRYPAGVCDVLQFIKNNAEKQSANCIGLLFKFLGVLTKMHIPSLIKMYPVISKQCFEWVSLKKNYCTGALTVLHTLISYLSQGDESVNEIEEVFAGGFTQIILPLQSYSLENDENYTLITSLLMLLDEALNVPQLRSTIIENLEPKVIRTLFQPLYSETLHTHVSHQSLCQDNSTHSPAVIVCVQLLHFINNLLSYDVTWMTLYSSLIREQSVLSLLSIALASGTYDMRRKVFAITGAIHFPGESVNILVKCLMESDTPHTNLSKISAGFAVESKPPSFQFSRQRDLDELIARLQELNENNKLESVCAHEVIEVMEFREMMSAEAEEVLQNSLAVAKKEIAWFQEKCFKSEATVTSLQKQLYCAFKSLEEARSDLASLSGQITKMEKDACETHEKNRLEVEEYQAGYKSLKTDKTKLEKINENLQSRLTNAEHDRKQMISELKQLHNQMNDLESQLDQERNKLSDVDKANQKLDQDNKNLRNEVAELEATSKKQFQTILNHEEQHKSLENKLQELQRIRDTIFEVAGGKKKF